MTGTLAQSAEQVGIVQETNIAVDTVAFPLLLLHTNASLIPIAILGAILEVPSKKSALASGVQPATLGGVLIKTKLTKNTIRSKTKLWDFVCYYSTTRL